MEVYTSKVYEIFSDEMDKSKGYTVYTVQGSNEFIVRHVQPDIVEQYKRLEFKVEYMVDDEKYICDCGLQDHVGYCVVIYYG